MSHYMASVVARTNACHACHTIPSVVPMHIMHVTLWHDTNARTTMTWHQHNTCHTMVWHVTLSHGTNAHV